MTDFRFFHPIEIRYGDLDPQGHVNNAKYLTYLEQARIAYIRRLGLWATESFLDVGIILAEVQITFRKPILFQDAIQVGVKTIRLGNKSMSLEHRIEGVESKDIFASATTVLVTYDYHQQTTIPIPENWRISIHNFEGMDLVIS